MTSIIAKILTIKGLFHTTYKLFIATIVIQFLSYLFTMSDYAQFSSSGVKNVGCGLIGKIKI